MPGEPVEPTGKVNGEGEKPNKLISAEKSGKIVEDRFRQKSAGFTDTAQRTTSALDKLQHDNPSVNLSRDMAEAEELKIKLTTETAETKAELTGTKTTPTAFEAAIQAAGYAADAEKQADPALREKLLKDALDSFVRAKLQALNEADQTTLSSMDGAISSVAGKLYKDSTCTQVAGDVLNAISGEISPFSLAKADAISKAAEAKKRTPDDEKTVIFIKEFVGLAGQNLTKASTFEKVPENKEGQHEAANTSQGEVIGKKEEQTPSKVTEIESDLSRLARELSDAKNAGSKAEIEKNLEKLLALQANTPQAELGDNQVVLQVVIDGAVQDVYGERTPEYLINQAERTLWNQSPESFARAEAILRLVKSKAPPNSFYRGYADTIQERIGALQRKGPPEKRTDTDKKPEEPTRPQVERKTAAGNEYYYMTDQTALSDLEALGTPPTGADALKFELRLIAEKPSREYIEKIRERITQELAYGKVKDKNYVQALKDIADRLKDPVETILEEDRKAAQEAAPEAFKKMDIALPEIKIGVQIPWEGKNCKVEKQLGAGAVGIAYLATTPEGKNIVLKVSKGKKDRPTEEKYQGEEYMLLRMADYQRKHNLLVNGKPLTPEFLGGGNTGDGRKFLAMTLAEGRNFDEIARSAREKGEYVNETDAKEIGIQACKTLDASHQIGKTYDDFHIGDLFWDKDSRKITMIDWDQLRPKVVADGRVLKPTPSYELSCLCRYLYAGMTGKTSSEIDKEEITEALKTSQLSPRMKEIFTRALDKDPSKRYQTADELKTDFEAVNAGSEQKV